MGGGIVSTMTMTSSANLLLFDAQAILRVGHSGLIRWFRSLCWISVCEAFVTKITAEEVQRSHDCKAAAGSWKDRRNLPDEAIEQIEQTR
jgi:hypothetical protein